MGPKQNWQTVAENFPSDEHHPATASRRITEGSRVAANSAAPRAPRTARPHHTAEDRPAAHGVQLRAGGKNKDLTDKPLWGETVLSRPAMLKGILRGVVQAGEEGVTRNGRVNAQVNQNQC